MNFHGIFAEYTSMSHFNMTEYPLAINAVQCTMYIDNFNVHDRYKHAANGIDKW